MNACRDIKKTSVGATLLSAILATLLLGAVIAAQAADSSEQAPALSTDAIVANVEARYDCQSFSAEFDQTSTLKAMNITDSASGRAVFKRPRKMRWEYTEPVPQQIISDGKTLWIYKPEDNQVIIGQAPVFFAKGNGASFLADIRTMREDFDINLVAPASLPDAQLSRDDCYVLQLDWKEKKFDLGAVYVFVSKTTFDVVRVDTISTYGDETTLNFHNIKLNKQIDDSFFTFDIPITAEIISLGE